jgi:hypothetical protein
MYNIYQYFTSLSDKIATLYDLNLSVFFVIYITSFIPFYLGYFLIIYGTTRKISWKNIVTLKLKGSMQRGSQAVLGVYIHLIGRVMPYVYILFFGKNLPSWIYILVIIALVLSGYYFYHTFLILPKREIIANSKFYVTDFIDNTESSEELWKIYETTFEPINRISPCKQSFDRPHFMEVLKDRTVQKYVLLSKDGCIIGIALTTNNFSNTPWISEEYFALNYKREHESKLIHYFMGLAIDSKHRGNKYSILLIESVIDSLPINAIMGFDHSKNVNPLLHHFTRIVKQSHLIERKKIDQQHYHVVQRK